MYYWRYENGSLFDFLVNINRFQSCFTKDANNTVTHIGRTKTSAPLKTIFGESSPSMAGYKTQPSDARQTTKVLLIYIHNFNRFIPDVPLTEIPKDDKSYIEATFGVLCNMPLLCDHSASWEILVSKRHIMEYTSDSDGEKIKQVPVN